MFAALNPSYDIAAGIRFVASASVMVAADFVILEQLGCVACWLLKAKLLPHCLLGQSY